MKSKRKVSHRQSKAHKRSVRKSTRSDKKLKKSHRRQTAAISMHRATNAPMLYGGAAMASGSSGCVFKPPLACANGQQVPSTYVTKLSFNNIAEDEYQRNSFIKNRITDIPNYADYFIFFDIKCKPANLKHNDLDQFSKCATSFQTNITSNNINKKLDELTTIHSMDGGLPLDTYIQVLGPEQLDFNAFHLSMIKLLRNGIVLLNDRNIIHADIKLDNVVYSKNTTKTAHLRLIDWGRALLTTDTRKFIKKDNDFHTLIQQPLAYSLMCNSVQNILQLKAASMTETKTKLLRILQSPHGRNEHKAEEFAGVGDNTSTPNSVWRDTQLNGILNKYYNHATAIFNWVAYAELLRSNYDVYGWLCLLNICWKNYAAVFKNHPPPNLFYIRAKPFIKKYMYTLDVLLNPYNIDTLITDFVYVTQIQLPAKFSDRTSKSLRSHVAPQPIMASSIPPLTLYFHTQENINSKKNTFDPNNNVQYNNDYIWDDGRNSRLLQCYKCHGRGCRNISCLTLPVCMVHLDSLFHLEIKPTTLGADMNGLFATTRINRGDVIMPYIGEIINKATYNSRYPRDTPGAYVFHDANNIIYDGATIRGVASWASRSSESNIANAKLTSYLNAYPNVIALKVINPGDEICIDNGDGRFDVVDSKSMFDTKCTLCPQTSL